MIETCPSWINGQWSVASKQHLPLATTRSNIKTTYVMLVNGTSSSIYNTTGYSDRAETFLCQTSIFDELNYVGSTIYVDIKYEVGINVIERGLIYLDNTDPRSKIKLDFAPHNWCQRPRVSSGKDGARGLPTTRYSNGTCTTPLTTDNCPSWLQGHWKFFGNVHGGIASSTKWVINENLLYNKLENTTTAFGTISCKSIISEKFTVRLDIAYTSPSLWSGRILRTLAKRMDRNKISVLIPQLDGARHHLSL